MRSVDGLARAAGRSIRRANLAPSTRRLLVDDITGAATDLAGRLRPNDQGVDADGFEPSVAAPFDVDLVYTWVDDDDLDWRTSYDEALKRAPRDNTTNESSHTARFENHDELRYSMRSVWRYAGWFRSIFVVTAGHRPAWLSNHPRVTVINHDDILSPNSLPTFNSHAIEAALHRISGLSEQFIYLNDDFFVGRPLGFEAFFDPSGRPKVFVSDHVTPRAGDTTVGQFPAARQTDQLIQSLTGSTAGYLLGHAPYPQLRSVSEELETRLADHFEGTASHRFRHPDDISVAASLAPWYAIATGRADRVTVPSEYVSVGHATTGAKLRRLRRRRDYDTFCLNWTEQSSQVWDQRVQRFLRRRFPDVAPWETE
ncbi:MAG: hypothetical protein ACI9N0_001975 [Ilumatobacter sp.]